MHPQITNPTGLPLEILHLADEEGRPVAVIVAQGTFDVQGEALVRAEEQPAIAIAGEPHEAVAAGAGYSPLPDAPPSWRLEPEFAFVKPAVDVVLLGHAYAPHGRATAVDVSLRVGTRIKTVRATGDRVFVERVTGIEPGPPAPFERIPLRWEHAFGGADPTVDVEPLPFEPRNPIGRGFRDKRAKFVEGLALPNLEDPAAPLVRWRQVVPPAGFGYVSPGWQPRAALAGTYDEAWMKDRAPHLAADFDRRFFHGAPADQVMALEGNELVEVRGATPSGRLRFALGGPGALVATMTLRDRVETLPLVLDTLIIDADRAQVRLVFRAHTTLRTGAHDVEALELAGTPPGRG